MMNKKGNLFLAVTIGLAIWIFGVLFIPFLTDDIVSARIGMDCSNVAISDGAKLSCLTVDLIIPYFIWFVISIAIGYIMGANR